MMRVLIQAGGAGTRLASITKNIIPKPMVRIGGKPILEHQVSLLTREGIRDITISISKSGKAIPDYFGDGSKFGCRISYIREDEPLGSGGAIGFLPPSEEETLFLFGDLMLDISISRFLAFHLEKGGMLTAFAHPNGHPYDSDVLLLDKSSLIKGILGKKVERTDFYPNLTNAGVYILSPKLVSSFGKPRKADFEKDVMAPLVGERQAYAYCSPEYVKDAGTVDRFEQVNEDLAIGIIASKNLSKKQKAIFLDRDGTLNVFGDFVTSPDKLFLAPGAAEAVKMINESSYLAIVITNQPVVARGETSFEELDRIHMKLADLLGEKGAYVDALYFCPHHPKSGFPGERKELKIECSCRKPKPGMILEAAKRFNIDLASSWMVGDTRQDVQTGINAGTKTVLLTSGDQRNNPLYEKSEPTFVAYDLLEAVKKILG